MAALRRSAHHRRNAASRFAPAAAVSILVAKVAYYAASIDDAGLGQDRQKFGSMSH